MRIYQECLHTYIRTRTRTCSVYSTSETALIVLSTAPEDFAGGEYNVTFMASPNAPGRSSVQVPTSPDMVFEDLEFFRCVLVIPPMDIDNVEKGEPDMARVNITDTTGTYIYMHIPV